MKIDYEKTEQLIITIKKYIDKLEDQKQIFDLAILKLSDTTQLDEIIVKMKSTSKKLESKICTLIQMKKAVEKVLFVYSDAENKIKSTIDSNWQVSKNSFANESNIFAVTDFLWRLE